MINLEEGRRFTDDVYASKDDVKATYNNNDIEKIWDQVLTYRSFYDHETDICDCEDSHYKVCLTRKGLGAAYQLEITLMNDLMNLMSVNPQEQNNFLLDRKVEALIATGKSMSLSSNVATIRKIATDDIESSLGPLAVYKAYSSAFDYASKIKAVTLEEIENINKVIIGEELTHDASYRSEVPDNVINPLKAPDQSKIQKHMNDLILLLNDNEIPIIERAIIVIYFFHYVRPFEFYNEQTAALTAKAVLSTYGLSTMGFVLDFESIAYAKSQKHLNSLLIDEKSLDLTYYLYSTMPYLSNLEKGYKETISELKKKSQAVKKIDPSFSESVNSESKTLGIGSEFKVSEEPKVYALPSFPSGVNADEIEKICAKLLQVYPKLKKKQAHFYAGHCTVGLHYTIEQFKECEDTVYETARTSMENLAALGFYRKEQVGKKFVYAPIPMKEEL